MIPFLPRSVTRKLPTASTRSTPGRHLTSGQATASKTQTVEAIEPHPSQSDNKGKHKDVCANPAYDEEYACLVYLSMSEYALWSNPDLRRRLEMSDEGFIPLAYLMEHLAPLSPITNELTEATLVKTIRTHAADTFDVRMLMENPSRAGWYGKDISHETSKGGFEVRRKDWREVLSCARNRSRRDWEGLTVYVENIPLQYRTVPGIFKFIQSLTDVAYTTAISTELQVQQILLPKHFRDKATDQPKCKGFALVTLSSTEGLEYLLHRWPWQRRINAADEDWSPQECEAHKFGFRVLPKAQWATLNEEYIAYRQSLLNQIAETEVPELHAKSDLEEVVEREIPALTPAPPGPESPDHGQTTIASPYPYNCLVFVRNIHPETNKTTLRTLFAKAFVICDRILPSGEGVDYVDFNKVFLTTSYSNTRRSSHRTFFFYTYDASGWP
ncbi:unnamed protein product [Somion occarium]|uniref:La-related protein 7 homolog xRRM domain-containing protein n=2 Tax=Somion occarium TaxID=3059160 RepID=A0ABP1CYT7_9APHY